jgi:hypothetical protein
MTHLYLNGIPVECSSSEMELVTAGEVTRSLNGQARSGRRVRKKDFRFTTDAGGLSTEEAERVRALILGDGHAWNFNDGEHSSRGLLPSAGTQYEIGIDEGRHKDGLRVFSLGGFIRWDLNADEEWTWDAWTLMAWVLEGATWRHYVWTSEGDCWKDGVSPATPTPAVGWAGSGLLQVGSVGDADEHVVDDLVALPWALPPECIGYVEAHCAAEEWPALPYVKATGPGVPSTGLTALGQVGTVRRVPMSAGGSFTTGEVFDFSLWGV